MELNTLFDCGASKKAHLEMEEPKQNTALTSGIGATIATRSLPEIYLMVGRDATSVRSITNKKKPKINTLRNI